MQRKWTSNGVLPTPKYPHRLHLTHTIVDASTEHRLKTLQTQMIRPSVKIYHPTVEKFHSAHAPSEGSSRDGKDHVDEVFHLKLDPISSL